MRLTAENVHDIFGKCLWEESELVPDREEMAKRSKVVEGVVNKVGFNPAKLEAHRADIEGMLSELPEGFKEGWSFLQGCVTKDGDQWGEQPTVEKLFMLGMGIDKVKLCAPKEMWSMLPGGVPYYQVID